jgi:hypothetical protein
MIAVPDHWHEIVATEAARRIGSNISPAPFPHPPDPRSGEPGIAFPYRQTTICPLGPSAVSPVESSIRRFRDDYVAHVTGGGCPYRPSRALVSA